MNKRILICSTAYLPLIGGAEVAIKEITDRTDGFEFDLITARIRKDLPKEEVLGNVHVYRVGWGSGLDKFLLPILGLKLACRLHTKQKYSLVWAMMASQASVLAVFFAKLKKVTLLTTLQEGDEESHLKRYALGLGFLYKILIRPWHRLAIKKADHIQVISDYLKERAQKMGATAPITVIPNGVHVEKFSREIAEDEKQALRNELGLTPSTKVVLSVSRLVHKNAMDILVRAMQHVDAVCVIAGSGPDVHKIEAHIAKLQLHSVRLLGDVEHKYLSAYYAIADVFVRPSRSEGQGISFIEAMAVGVPVIATPVGGIVDFLKDGETGLYCEVDNPQDVAEKINIILGDSELAEKLAKNAQKVVSEKYDWNILSQKMQELFISITHV